jgi:hypothetical protein
LQRLVNTGTELGNGKWQSKRHNHLQTRKKNRLTDAERIMAQQMLQDLQNELNIIMIREATGLGLVGGSHPYSKTIAAPLRTDAVGGVMRRKYAMDNQPNISGNNVELTGSLTINGSTIPVPGSSSSASPTIADITLTGLAASTLLSTNGSKTLTSLLLQVHHHNILEVTKQCKH